MGLLSDYLPSLPTDPSQNDAARQGLLAFGAAMLGGRGNFGQILGQGLAAGAGGYNSALQALQQKALMDAQTKHLSLENTAAQTAIDQQKSILADLNGQQGQAPQAPSAATQLVSNSATALTPNLSSLPQASPADTGAPLSMIPQASTPPVLPTSAPDSAPAVAPVANLPQVGVAQDNPTANYQKALATAQFIAKKYGATAAKPYFDQAKLVKPEAKEIKTVTLPDGSRVMAQFYSDGSPPQVIQGMGPDKEKLVGYSGGGTYNFADPFTGKTVSSSPMTVTPGEQLQHQDQVAARAQQDRHFNIEQANKDDPKETQFMRELAAMYPKGSPEYDEALRQRINKEAGINAGGGGGRSVVYNGRIIASGNEVAQALRNIADLPVQSNSGFLGMGKADSSSLVNASIAGLKHSLNDDQIKTYNTMWTGVSRNLGTLETSGLATTGDLIKSIDKLQFVPGDNGYNALRKLAEVRQITEAALEPKLHDPAVPGQQREYIKGVIDAVHQAVPYTHADLTRYDRAAQKNPSLTFQEFAAQTVNKDKPAPTVKPVASLPQKPSVPADISGLLNKYGNH